MRERTNQRDYACWKPATSGKLVARVEKLSLRWQLAIEQEVCGFLVCAMLCQLVYVDSPIGQVPPTIGKADSGLSF